MEEYIKRFKEKGKIIIEDITHSILSEKRYSEYSDYLVGSLRKWFPISTGGIVVNRNSKFALELKENSNEQLINVKNEAMRKKKAYIKNNEGSKEEFLDKYNESAKILNEDYKDYSIDEKSYEIIQGINLDKIKQSRRENAKLIYEKLIKNPNIKFLINKYNENDCLLFVPILLENSKRNELRNYLISEKIYLPVHWPMEEKINNIFDRELSLVCDQRYTKQQIENYINLVINYLQKN